MNTLASLDEEDWKNLRDYVNTLVLDKGKFRRWEQATAPILLAHMQKQQRERETSARK